MSSRPRPGRIAVIGLGAFGAALVQRLAEGGADTIVIDSDRSAVESISHLVRSAVVADASDEETLEAIGVAGCDTAVVNTGPSMEASILTTLHLRRLGVPQIQVKCLSDAHGAVVRKMGATTVLFPEKESAERLAGELCAGGSWEGGMVLPPELSTVSVEVPTSFLGKSLTELELRERFGTLVIAIQGREDREPRLVPDPSSPLKEGDRLLLLGQVEDLARVVEEG